MLSECEDCGKHIDPRARRCRSCAARAAHARGDFDGILDNPETRRKISEGVRAAHARGAYGGPETRSKRSDSARVARAHDSPETKRKRSEAMRVRWQDPEYRHKVSEGLRAAHVRGAYGGPETKRKRSEGAKAAHARGDFGGPETKRKRSEVARAQWRDPEIRSEMSGARKAAWARGVYDGVFQSPTSIELGVAAALDICGIEHVSQHRPDGQGRVYDEFVLPDILVEIHGDYWHGSERPENQKRDIEKAQWAEDNGYHLVVMWEHEIKEQGAWSLAVERVLPLVGGEPKAAELGGEDAM